MFGGVLKTKIKSKRRISSLYDLEKLIKTTLDYTKPSDITDFSVFDIMKPESVMMKVLEKFAVLAAVLEVIAVVLSFVKFKYATECIYAAVYLSVVITVLLPFAKFFDSILSYKRFIKNIQSNQLDRALLLSFFLGVGRVIGKTKMIEISRAEKHFFYGLKNKIKNFWDNTRIHGNFTEEFEKIFGSGSFIRFIKILNNIENEYIGKDEIHVLVSSFFEDDELWNNKSCINIITLLNYGLSGELASQKSSIKPIEQIDYFLLSYFKYAKIETIHDIETFFLQNQKYILKNA